MRILPAVACLLAFSLPAGANDTMAELGTGGLTITRSDVVSMESEDLFISLDQVRVAYVFRNTGETDVESIVAFPMPDIDASPYDNVSIPDSASDNFLDFQVTVDGAALEPTLEQRAIAADIDVTDLLRARGISLFPYREGIEEQLAVLTDAERDDWLARGIVVIDSYDAGDGMKDHSSPAWTLKSTYWWRMTFPAGRTVKVSHVYKPSVGGSVGLNFTRNGKVGGDSLAHYRTTYCMDKSFESAVERVLATTKEDGPYLYENWIKYVLTTGGNWRSNIGKFKLTIDKGKPDGLVSFCGENVEKTGPTTFTMTAEDFYPEKDLNILILQKSTGAAQ